jgi:hypothetical protein
MRDALEIEVDTWMRQFAAIDDREHALPDPSIIWLKAKVLQSAKEVARASRAVTPVEIISQASVASLWAALLTWKWDAISSWFVSFSSRDVLFAAPSVNLPFVMTLAVLTGITVMVAMHSILVEE